LLGLFKPGPPVSGAEFGFVPMGVHSWLALVWRNYAELRLIAPDYGKLRLEFFEKRTRTGKIARKIARLSGWQRCQYAATLPWPGALPHSHRASNQIQ